MPGTKFLRPVPEFREADFVGTLVWCRGISAARSTVFGYLKLGNFTIKTEHGQTKQT